jgi:flagellar basal-body rod protein FlgB
MDFNKISIFNLAKKRLSWTAQRQEVLAQNIANSDTPRYKPSDLKPFKFRELLQSEKMQLNMNSTQEKHMGGRRKRIRDFASEVNRKPYETSIDGNAVVLEEQMMKINDNTTKHKLANELYKKHLGLFRLALGKR